jgi:hypothetical protein
VPPSVCGNATATGTTSATRTRIPREWLVNT